MNTPKIHIGVNKSAPVSHGMFPDFSRSYINGPFIGIFHQSYKVVYTFVLSEILELNYELQIVNGLKA